LRQPPRRILRFGKPLDGEIYVASEAGATPPQNYAPINRGDRLGQLWGL